MYVVTYNIMCRYKIPVVRNFCVPNPINSTGYTSMQLLLFYRQLLGSMCVYTTNPRFIALKSSFWRPNVSIYPPWSCYRCCPFFPSLFLHVLIQKSIYYVYLIYSHVLIGIWPFSQHIIPNFGKTTTHNITFKITK